MNADGNKSPIRRILDWRQKNPERYKELRLKGLRQSEKIKEAARRTLIKYRKKNIAKRMKQKRFQRGPENVCATKALLRSPQNVIYLVVNVTDFVRSNPQLFPSDDLNWHISSLRNPKTYLCRAVSGLCSLIPYRRDGRLKTNVQGSWKGWTFVSNVEIKEQSPSGRDLLDRQNL